MNGDLNGDEYDTDVTGSERPMEADAADAFEQERDVSPHEAETPPEVRDDVDPGDVAEQSRVVELDEDDYR